MSIDACAQIVERGDPDRFLAVMAAPVTARPALMVLYAFNLEVARAPWVTKEPMIAEMRLQWWRDVIGEDTPRAHEVAGPLHALITAQKLPVYVLDRMIEARRWDIYKDAFEDAAAFSAYLEDTAGGLMWLAALALGAPPAAERAVRDYAWAAGLANYLRAVPDLEARGRLPLIDGRPEAVRNRAQEGLVRLDRARGMARSIPRHSKPALLAGWQTEGLLRQVVQDPGRVAVGQLQLSEFSRRGRLLWQALTGRF